MVSVTPDITSSTFQAPTRAKPDPSPGNDSFASLVDSNITAAANSNDCAQGASPIPQPAASDRRPAATHRDDTAAADKSRDAKSDKADNFGSSDASDDRNAAAADPADTAKPADAGETKPSKSKSADIKNDEPTSAGKPPTGDGEATDPTDTKAANGQAITDAAVAIATAIPVAVVATDVPAASPSPSAITPVTKTADNGPLAIAAAAIAPSTDVSEAATAAVATPATTDATVKTVVTDAKLVTQEAAGEKAADSRQAALAGDPAKATDAALTAAATATPAAPKTAASQKPTSGAGAKATTTISGDTDVQASSTDAADANTTTPPVAVGTEQPGAAKPTDKNAPIEATRTEPAGAKASPATAAHLTNAAAGPDWPPSQTTVQGNGAPAAATFQTQLQASSTQVQPSFTVTAATPATVVPLSGLAMEIAASAQSGKSRFEIRLDPAELGRIDVRIDVDRNGRVNSHLTVEKPETLSMLRQDAPQLQRALNDAGLSTGDSGLQFSLRDQSSSGQNGNQSNPNAQRLIITEDEAFPAAAASSYARMLGSSGGVDIRV